MELLGHHSLQNLPYSERLQNLKLLYHRSHVDLIMTYKILNETMLVDKDNEDQPH